MDHALKAHFLAVFGRIESLDAIRVQVLDLLARNHAAAAAKHLDMAGAPLLQQIDHIFEIFGMAALIGADGDALCVFLDCGVDDLIDRAVMPEMNHFRAGRLHDPAHDIDRRVVPVKEAGRGDEANLLVSRR